LELDEYASFIPTMHQINEEGYFDVLCKFKIISKAYYLSLICLAEKQKERAAMKQQQALQAAKEKIQKRAQVEFTKATSNTDDSPKKRRSRWDEKAD
jgi:hypothetical protein